MPANTTAIPLGRLKKRAEFLRVRQGRSWRTPSLVLQAHKRTEADCDLAPARVGFTATKRLGGAVVRNRARRRLKEGVRLSAGAMAQPGYDYVVIARHGVLKRSFPDIQNDLDAAFRRVHKAKHQ